jgi:hypothetical protein
LGISLVFGARSKSGTGSLLVVFMIRSHEFYNIRSLKHSIVNHTSPIPLLAYHEQG